MPSYGAYRALPVVANPTMLGRILRREIGFDGLVVSDYGAINGLLKKYKVVKDTATAEASKLVCLIYIKSNQY